MEISQTDLFYIVTIHNDQISNVKHGVDPIYVFYTLFGCWRGAEAALKRLGHNLPMHFPALGSPKKDISEAHCSIFSPFTKMRYRLQSMFQTLLMCFSTCLVLEAAVKGLWHNLLMRFSALGFSKMKISKTIFFCILTIHNDKTSYVKHVLDPLYVLFTLFVCLDGCKGLG